MTAHSVIIELPNLGADAASVSAAREIIAVAAEHGADAVLIPHNGDSAADPTVIAGLLSADRHSVSLLIEAHTGRHAPFNLARRVQTLARITGGRAGLYLRDTGVDPVTAAHRPHAATPASVAGEYTRLLRRLWDSFPESALLGDQASGEFADVDQITPARHAGDVYGVAGALNVPIAPDQRPVLLADAGAVDEEAPIDAVIGGDAVAGPLTYTPLTWALASEGDGRFSEGSPSARGVLLRLEASLDTFAAHLRAALGALPRPAGNDADVSLWQHRLAATTAA